MADDLLNENTRERILDAAEILFARKGYRAVSIRQIIRAAHCNLAAVNYHFGQKKNLYLEVFRSRWIPRARRVQAAFRKSLDNNAPHTLDDVVRALTDAFIQGPMSEEERQRHHQLMAREQARPSEALELIVNEVMRPFFVEVAGLLHPFMPDDMPDDALYLYLLSMFSQILYFSFARAAVTRMTGGNYDPSFKAHLSDHIVTFCLRGFGSAREAKR